MYSKNLKPLLFFFFLIGCSITSFGSDYYKVNTERLNVRSTTGASSSPFGYVSSGDTVDVIDKSNAYWYKIKIQDKEGYVRSKYLLQITNPINSDNQGTNSTIYFFIGFIVFAIIICIVALFTNKKKQNNIIDGTGQVTTVIIKNKSVGLAILLTIFFGPFGMFYSTVLGAFIMFSFPIGAIILVGLNYNAGNYSLADYLLCGLYIFGAFYWLICIIWAAVAAGKSSKVIISQTQPLINNES